jgi:S-DNA-T family DNA segregation ATPase FtsK/SpoIIIE
MTDPVTEPTLGTVHDLADHRVSRTTTLAKPPVDAERAPLEGIVLPKQPDQPAQGRCAPWRPTRAPVPRPGW